MPHKTEFLYLSEKDTIDAGVLNATRCVDNAEEVFIVMGQGDYLMGGSNHNSHGLGLVFPDRSPFPNMPLAGPDRRFVAMPAYLGGRFNLCGNKWYGSNAANKEKGLPRSVLTVFLNDKDTGEPLSLLSANLLSAARTGAIPGVATRHLANEESKVIAILGCGQINRSCLRHILTQLPDVEKVLCYDIVEKAAESFVAWAAEEYPLRIEIERKLDKAVSEADVVSVAASRTAPLYLEDAWLKKGVTLLISGPVRTEDSFWESTKIVLDNVKLHESYVSEAIASGDKTAYYADVIGGQIYTLIDEGKLPPLKDFLSMGDVITGKKPGRESKNDRIAFIACGMATFDVGLGYDLYQEALNRGLGTWLTLWEDPYQNR